MASDRTNTPSPDGECATSDTNPSAADYAANMRAVTNQAVDQGKLNTNEALPSLDDATQQAFAGPLGGAL